MLHVISLSSYRDMCFGANHLRNSSSAFLHAPFISKFGQHEFLGPSSPDTFLRIPPHPGARLPGHVTDFPGLRFGTVDFDEAKRIVHLFSCFQFLCEQRAQYIVSVFFISRALILKILFSSPPGSRVCCADLSQTHVASQGDWT